jgi:hypothetical protein
VLDSAAATSRSWLHRQMGAGDVADEPLPDAVRVEGVGRSRSSNSLRQRAHCPAAALNDWLAMLVTPGLGDSERSVLHGSVQETVMNCASKI